MSAGKGGEGRDERRARREATRRGSSGRRPPPRGRRGLRGRVPVALALGIALLALVVGFVVGYQARDAPPIAGLQTVEREVVIVTVPEEPTP